MNSPLPAYYNFSRPEVSARLQPQGARVLDVGCAAGAMGAKLLEQGALEVVGLERQSHPSSQGECLPELAGHLHPA